MSTEIQLIREIEKRRCLYNFTCPEYNRKEITEETWADVAQNVNLAISDCKEKWRNIRSSFLRSLKPGPGGNNKKPYYLSEFLQFLIPYLKPVTSEIPQPSPNDASEPTIEIKQEILDEYDTDQEHEVPITKEHDPNVILTEHPRARRKRRLFKALTEPRAKRRFLFRPSNPAQLRNDAKIESGNAMKYFLMSLLPEFETMDEEQTRLFKIKVMLLINELKTNPDRQTASDTDSENKRLQKRLINLLIKTLAKKT